MGEGLRWLETKLKSIIAISLCFLATILVANGDNNVSNSESPTKTMSKCELECAFDSNFERSKRGNAVKSTFVCSLTE